jgi:CheY-like chemotaxis protein
MTSSLRKVLLVEDEAISALSLRIHLTSMGYEVLGPIASGEEAVAVALSEHPLCILMDINLIGRMTGLDAAEEICRHDKIPIIFITGYANPEIREEADRIGHVAYLEKPVNVKALVLLLVNLTK